MSLYSPIVTLLAVWAILGFGAALALFGVALRPGGRNWLRRTLGDSGRQPIAGAWVVAAVAMAGSLYFSDVVGFPPCLLCWYQRILMYPLVLLLGVGLWLREPGIWRITLPLPLLGLVIAAYHVALQYRPSIEILACDAGVPCSGRYLAVFGFVSIPTLSAVAFLMIVALMVVASVAEGSPDAPADVSG